MKKLPKNSKLNLFKKTWISAQTEANSANKKALESGKILSELKEENRGGWAKFVEQELKGVIGLVQADKLIKIYENEALIRLASEGETLSINEMIGIISQSSQALKDEAKAIKAAEEQKQAEAKAERKLAELATQKAEPEILEGEFEEVISSETKKEEILPPVYEETSLPDAKIEAIGELRDMFDEAMSENKALQEENESLVKTFESNDQLATALAEVKKLQEMNRILNERITGLLNEKNMAIQTAKKYKGMFERLEKSIKAGA